VQVVVAAPVPHVGSERRRQIFRLVLPIRSITWLDTKAGNQRTRSRATAKSSDTQTARLTLLPICSVIASRRACAVLHGSPGTRTSNQDRQTENDPSATGPPVQYLGPIARDPYSRRNLAHVSRSGWPSYSISRAGCEITENLLPQFQLDQLTGFLPSTRLDCLRSDAQSIRAAEIKI